MDRGTTDESLLVRTLARALRHVPWEYFLEVDSQGWEDLDCVLLALRYDRPEWSSLDIGNLVRLCGPADAARFEIADGRIRALYGHSIPGVVAGVRSDERGTSYTPLETRHTPPDSE